MPFGIVACTFSDNLSRNSCIQLAKYLSILSVKSLKKKGALINSIAYLSLNRDNSCTSIFISSNLFDSSFRFLGHFLLYSSLFPLVQSPLFVYGRSAVPSDTRCKILVSWRVDFCHLY